MYEDHLTKFLLCFIRIKFSKEATAVTKQYSKNKEKMIKKKRAQNTDY